MEFNDENYMECPNCGGAVDVTGNCQYCGTRIVIPVEKKKFMEDYTDEEIEIEIEKRTNKTATLSMLGMFALFPVLPLAMMHPIFILFSILMLIYPIKHLIETITHTTTELDKAIKRYNKNKVIK
jgi:DNA-directed RNA polymerase subunit RPC12/RpoP